jgi:hypothetical protein
MIQWPWSVVWQCALKHAAQYYPGRAVMVLKGKSL